MSRSGPEAACREAAKYRRRLREVEAERDALADQLRALRQQVGATAAALVAELGPDQGSKASRLREPSDQSDGRLWAALLADDDALSGSVND